MLRAAERGEPGPPVGDLYEVGDRLGHLGVYALGAAALLAAAAVHRRSRNPLALLGGAVVALACWPFRDHHVFAPYGVLALVGVAAGLGLLELGRRPRR